VYRSLDKKALSKLVARLAVPVLFPVAALTGCSADRRTRPVTNTYHAPERDAHNTGVDGATTDTDSGSTDNTVSMTMGPVNVTPGQERVVCLDRKLPTDHAIDIDKISAEITTGGHHLVFYKSNETVESAAPFECSSFRGVFNRMVPLFIAQKHDSELQFPKGIAYTLPAAQMVRIELHFLNTTAAPLDVSGAVHLGIAKEGAVTDHANISFIGSLNINIPPNSEATVGPLFHTFSKARQIFGLTGHEHQRGTGFTIDLGAQGGQMTSVYSNNDWAEPPLTVFDPPLPVEAGQGLRFACKYFNPTNQAITFGEGFNQEMCFLWAYYYPDMGFEIGLH
jgi:hypothetical protein